MKIIATILFLGAFVSAQQCETVQYWNIASDDQSRYPINAIVNTLDDPISLTDIPFTNNAYTITKIVAKPFIPNYKIDAVKSQLDLNVLKYSVEFQVIDANKNIVTQGRTEIAQAVVTVAYTSTAYNQWTVSSAVLAVTSQQLPFIYLTQNALYTDILTALNTGGATGSANLAVIQQLKTYYTDSVVAPLNTNLQNYLNAEYGSSYNYLYTNINGQVQTVNFNQTTLSAVSANNILTVQRVLSILGQTNKCSSNVTEPTVPGIQAKQISSYSIAQIYNLIEYATSQGFFNTILNQNWNSPIFQFNAGTFKNFMNGIQASRQPQEQFTGSCQATYISSFQLTQNKNLRILQKAILAGEGLLPISLDYKCQIDQPGQGQGQLVTSTFTLNGTFKITADVNQLVVIGNEFNVLKPQFFSQDVFLVKNPELAQVYMQSVVRAHLEGQKIFGTGFQTLLRQTGQIGTLVTDNEVIIYEYTSQTLSE